MPNNKKVKVKDLKKTKKNSKKRLKKIIRILLIIFIVCVLLGAIGVAAIFFNDEWAITEEDLKIQNINSVAYDKDGKLIAELTGDERRVTVTMSEISEFLPKAFVAIEDERFYKHNGVDLKRTAAATFTFILNRGSSSFGGSTITQQLVKNMMNEKADTGMAGIIRKVKEMSRAYQIERMISKHQVVELYLNVIFMGQQTYGVEVASGFYFSKTAKDLDLVESAFLAGINHSPNAYNPFNPEVDNSEKIKKRTKTVLGKMLELNYINQEAYDSAIAKVNEGIVFKKGNSSTEGSYSYHTAAAINQVITQLMKEKDLSYEMAKVSVFGKGLKIYTTQDTEIQTKMEEEFKKSKYVVKSKKTKNEETGEYEHSQAAMVIIDHKTGKVVGTVGGLGSDVDATGLNRATQSIRQIGSTMKPIGVVAPGLEQGVITAGTVYDDSPSSFGKYKPKNSTGYMGLATVRKAIEVSSNIMNVKMMSNIGPSNAIEFLRKLGITSLNDSLDANLSLALGSASISPLETAAAYATIANDGKYITPFFYTKVEDRSGEVILEPEIETREVMSKENAFVLKSILTAPVNGVNGTAKNCSIAGMDVAAKTGTTDDNYDRWLCGFTTYYTAATWYGYDQKEKIYYSGNPASYIWAGVMRGIHSKLEKTTFEKPEGVVSAAICMDSGCVATESCTRVYSEYFVKGTVPKKCEGHEHVSVCLDTNCLANEFCTNVEERIYLQKPEKEINPAWATSSGEKYTRITDICSVHKEPVVEKVKVLNVIGLTESEAIQKLKDLKLKVTAKYVENSMKKDGVVLKQSISENEEVETHTEIVITVNKREKIPEDNEENEIDDENENLESDNSVGVQSKKNKVM